MDAILANYHPALLALTLLCLAVLAQSILIPVFAFTKKGGQSPGLVVGGPEQHSFRVIRTYLNSIENLPGFIAILFVAIIVGVSPKWVNFLAGIHVAARIVYWPVYYSKLGIKTPGPRTLIYIVGMLANLALAVMTLLALI